MQVLRYIELILLFWRDIFPQDTVIKFSHMVNMGYGGGFTEILDLEPWKFNVLFFEISEVYKEKIERLIKYNVNLPIL